MKYRMMRSAAVAAAILTLCTGLLACKGRGGSAEQRYDLKGKVVNVDQRGSAVTVAHEEIPGYMPAMTMPLKVKDEWVFRDLAPGDRVQATLVVSGDSSWLEGVVVSREMADGSGGNGAAVRREPERGDEVPDFSLVNQDGRRINLHQYRGRALILTFIYTRCPLPDYCPLMTENFTRISEGLKQDPELYERTRLLSISVDPEYDTPKVMRAYAESNGQRSFDHWEFATGLAEEVRRTADYFGLEYYPESDQIIHSLRTALIAPDGKLLKIYRGNEWKPAELLTDLRTMNAPTQVIRGVGVVEAIDRQMGTVQINHEDIKDFMPAHSMPFPVKDRALLDAAGPGDRIEFAFEANSEGMIVIEIKKR